MQTEKRKIWMKEYNKQYRIKNLDKEKERAKEYRIKNKEKLKIYEKNRDPEKEKLRRKIYNKNNRSKINTYVKNRYHSDIKYKITCVLRARLYSIMRNHPRNGSAVTDLGCSIEDFKKHIESKFLKGMSWDSWSYKGWHIDHIKPLSSFNLLNREEFLRACHYTNLQPMWSMDNHKKSNKII
jgi:hypothetical protein